MWDFDLGDLGGFDTGGFDLGFEDPNWSTFDVGNLGGDPGWNFDFGDPESDWTLSDIPSVDASGPWADAGRFQGVDSLDLGSQMQIHPWTAGQNLDPGPTPSGFHGVDSQGPPQDPTEFFMGESAPFSPTEADPTGELQARGISPEEAVYRANAEQMTAGPGGGVGQKLVDLKNQAVSLVSNKTYELMTGKTPDEIIQDLQNPNPTGAVRDIRSLYPDYSTDFDKLEHSYASYLMANRLGYYPALGIGGLKELTDIFGTGFSLDDLLADVRGANLVSGPRPSFPVR